MNSILQQNQEKSYKLLLIDDDKVDRSSFQRFLNKSDISCEIQAYSYGLEGFDAFKENQFDCVFLDYNLPDIDGLEILGKILAVDPLASIVIMTGEGDEFLAAQAIKSGASDYLPKDALTPVVLVQCLQNLEMRKAKEEAEQHNKAKSEFLSRMSHELRTPMNAILGFAQLMSESEKDPLSEAHQARVSQILNAGRHLMDLINDVLELSRIEKEEDDVSIESICVAELVEEVFSMVHPISEEFHVDLIDNISSHKGIYALGDKMRLRQVLLNLVSNGIKYNCPKGSVTLTVDILDEKYLRINVNDTGIGIANEKLASLFKPFDRLGAEYSEVEGTGIGLTISKKLIELMNGSIGVKTFVGKGSEFHILLPRAPSCQT